MKKKLKKCNLYVINIFFKDHLKKDELFYESISFINQNRGSLKSYLPIIRKLYNVPRKNLEQLKNKSSEFKLQKYKILNKLFEILKFISESKDTKSDKSADESEELMKTILVNFIN